MNKRTSLANPKTSREDEDFYFNRLTGKPYWDFRKMLGRQLFKIRQDSQKSLESVSHAVKVPAHIIDSVELGSKCLHWDAISRLLDYYQKRVKLFVVEKYTPEEKETMREERSNQQLIEEARAIIDKTKQCEDLEKEIAAASEIVALSSTPEEVPA